jgi:tetratricopeptide (TPR) repeat protein
MAIRRGQYGEAVELAGEAVKLDTDAAVAARAQLILAWALDKHDWPEEALDQVLGALATYRLLGEPNGQAHALNGAGWCYGRLHDHRQMLSHCVQALRMYRTLGNARGEAAALDSVGRAHHHLGGYAEAVRHYRLALDIDVRLRDRYNEAETLCHLAETYQASGQPAEARSAWVRALELLHAVNHPSAEDVAARLRELRESSLPAMAYQSSPPAGT